MCDLFPNAAGGDIDSWQNEDCRKRFAAHPGISFLSIDELEQPAHRGGYDIVTCMEVLEHCLPETTEKVIGDLRRLVAPGGTVVISVPIEIGPTLIGKQMVRAIAGWRSIGDYKYREKYTAAELATMLLADERTAIERPIYSGSAGAQPSHGHKGFNWRALRHRLQDAFEIRRNALFSARVSARLCKQPGVDHLHGLRVGVSRRVGADSQLPAKIRVAVIADFIEERWPSMDLVAEMLSDHLAREHAQCFEVELVRPRFIWPSSHRQLERRE